MYEERLTEKETRWACGLIDIGLIQKEKCERSERENSVDGTKYTDRSKVIMRLQIRTCREAKLHLPCSVYNRKPPTLIEEYLQRVFEYRVLRKIF